MTKKYLYVFTRKNLDPSQIAVQSIHSAFEMGRHFCKSEVHPSVVLIKAKDEMELEEYLNYIKSQSLNYKEFREPYYDNSLTSFTLEPITQDKRELLKRFKLFRNKDFKEVLVWLL